MNWDIGTQVMLVAGRGVPPGSVGRYAEIVGVKGGSRCELGEPLYTIEYFYGGTGYMCGCCLMKTPPANTKVSWARCVWEPKEQA